MFSKMAKRYADGNMIIQILIGIILGIAVGFWGHSQLLANGETTVLADKIVGSISVLGGLFVGALKAVAPVLVFVLVATSIITKDFGESKGMGKVVSLYLIATFLASAAAVCASFLFPVELVLQSNAEKLSAPQNVVDVLKTLIFK